MKNFKYLVRLIIFIIFCASAYIMVPTISKYTSINFFGDAQKAIAKWDIKVNNESITDKNELSQNVEMILIDNPYVVKGKVAPGSEGYFDLTFDFNLIEVSAKYIIQIDENSSEETYGFQMIGYEKGDEITENPTSAPIDTFNVIEDGKIEGIKKINENSQTQEKFRIYTKWINDENINQNVAGINATQLTIPFIVNVEQYDGGEERSDANTVKLSEIITGNDIGNYIDLGNSFIGTESTSDDWKILYMDSNNVYAKLNDYLPTSYMNENSSVFKEGNYGIGANTSSEILQYLGNQNNWNFLCNGIAEASATGAPTSSMIESLCLKDRVRTEMVGVVHGVSGPESYDVMDENGDYKLTFFWKFKNPSKFFNTHNEDWAINNCVGFYLLDQPILDEMSSDCAIEYVCTYSYPITESYDSLGIVFNGYCDDGFIGVQPVVKISKNSDVIVKNGIISVVKK